PGFQARNAAAPTAAVTGTTKDDAGAASGPRPIQRSLRVLRREVTLGRLRHRRPRYVTGNPGPLRLSSIPPASASATATCRTVTENRGLVTAGLWKPRLDRRFPCPRASGPCSRRPITLTCRRCAPTVRPATTWCG